MTRFSVIIPVYDVGAFLRECLDSVLAAAARLEAPDEVEVICVDDGSTDDSGAIADSYAAACGGGRHACAFRVLHLANGGVSAARNRALDLAKGEWISFVDGDDFVRDTYFVDLVAAQRAHPGVELIGFEKAPYYGNLTWAGGEAAFEDVGIDRRIDDYLVRLCVWQMVYRRDVFGHLRFRPYGRGEDLVYACEAFARARSCVVTRRMLYGYRYREGSATHSGASADKLLEVIAFSGDMFKVLAASGKDVGRMFTIGRGNEWIEALPKVIFQFEREGGDGADRVWESWFRSMGEAAGMPLFTSWQRFVARTVARTRSKLVVRFLCCLPLRLKRKGWLRK